MKLLLQLTAILQVTLKRLWSQLGMTLATTFGLTMAVALLAIVPLYADAVNFRILEEELANDVTNSRPPFAYMYTYVGAWYGHVESADIEPVTDYLFSQAADVLNLPQEMAIRHVKTPTFKLFPLDATSYANDESLGFMNLASTSGIESQIQMIEGSFPMAEAEVGETLEVIITQAYADEVGWQVGEEYLALDLETETRQTNFRIRVSGIWVPTNDKGPFWFYLPETFDTLFVVNEATFQNAINPAMDNEVALALWYLVMDGSRVGTEQVDELIFGAARIEQRIDLLLPKTTEFLAPTDALQIYRQSVSELAILLYTFDVAPIWLVLSFVVLVVGLAVSQQKNEIAVMRSRGSTPGQVLGMAALEGVLLGSVAFVLGILLAVGLTQIVGRSRSFLDFSGTDVVRMVVTRQALYTGAIAIGLALIARILPVIAASRHTIITFKQEQARSLAQPWWQRVWLDVILLVVVGYGFYLLQQQGSIGLINDEASAADPFQNPLLLLLPAMGIFALTLFFLRVLPWVMLGLGTLLNRTQSVGLLQAVRYLARTPHHYRPPLSLLVLTVGLAVFTASLARTVDLQLYDQNFYDIGAEISMVTLPNPPAFGGAEPSEEDSFTYLPVSDYETIENIERAARVGSYSMEVQVDGVSLKGEFVGVDHADFRDVAYWRWDFSEYRLGSLMNALGDRSNGILVPESLLSQSTLNVGDPIRYSVRLDEVLVEFDGIIVGTFRYFPSWQPAEEAYLIVGNLNTVFEKAGGEFPYRVWAELDGPLIDAGDFRRSLADRQLFNTFWKEPHESIVKAQAEPERQGLFGILSVGFIASAVLTVLGFFLYTLFSFRRRTVELGILRAVGISRRTMTAIVAWELGLLILSGLIVGTVLGVLVSQQFIPFLQVGSATNVAPPYLVEIAWEAVVQIYVLFGVLFLVAMAVLSWRLLNMKVFESIKMGETV
ncbi:MAG: putative ABC transport system permease protein [Cellvibrionaceae bacterium]|jgi:putative ABC transport system permease protein